MAQKSGKKRSSVSGAKKKVIPVKKTAVKQQKKAEKRPAGVKRVIVKAKKKETPAPKVRLATVPQEFRVNIRCRYCFFVDGYSAGEKTCHNCKEEIYEIDKI